MKPLLSILAVANAWLGEWLTLVMVVGGIGSIYIGIFMVTGLSRFIWLPRTVTAIAGLFAIMGGIACCVIAVRMNPRKITESNTLLGENEDTPSEMQPAIPAIPADTPLGAIPAHPENELNNGLDRET